MKKVSAIGVLAALVFSLTSCPDHKYVDPTIYKVHIYYKNGNGEDLLDPATAGHYDDNNIKVNGLGVGTNAFFIKSNADSTLPKGYALSFLVSSGFNSPTNVITINSLITDTLSTTFSGAKLVSCKYNRVEVLPTHYINFEFPVTIVK